MRNIGKGYHYIITGHTVGSLKRNVVEPFNTQFGTDIRLDNDSSFRLFGNTVHCFGSDKQDSYKSLTGMTAHGWYGNEVTLSHPNTIHEAFNRCSGDGFQILWDTNPDYPEHYIKKDYIDKSGEMIKKRVRIKAFHFTIDDNPYLSRLYITNLKKSTPLGMWYNRKIKGMWVAAEGMIWEGWNRDIHVKRRKMQDNWTRVRGIDFGYTNPFVMLWGAIDPDGRLHIYREHYKSQMLIKDHVAHIRANQDYHTDGDLKGDAIEYIWTVADHDAQERAEYEDNDVPTIPAQKQVLIGIQKVAERLVVQGDGMPRLTISPDCPSLISEIEQYVWMERKDGKPVKEEPNKVNDHGPDVVRYISMELDYSTMPEISAVIRR